MRRYQEVEAKYSLLNKKQVLNRINQLNLKQSVQNEIQNDSYYVPTHRNFLEQEIVSEWLRIRVTEKKCTLNFKQWLPIGEKIQNQCNEYETIVEDEFALKKIFQLLDFKEIISVRKVRNSWIFNDIEISIDEVEELGTFIELEAIQRIKEEDIPDMQRRFIDLLQIISAEVGEQNRRGYPYMVLEKSKEI